jgi:hypothetical protein
LILSAIRLGTMLWLCIAMRVVFTECENDGLRRFKLSWGTEEDTMDYFRVDSLGRQCLVAAPSDSGLHTKIFGRLPLIFNRLAGSMIYPHLD